MHTLRQFAGKPDECLGKVLPGKGVFEATDVGGELRAVGGIEMPDGGSKCMLGDGGADKARARLFDTFLQTARVGSYQG